MIVKVIIPRNLTNIEDYINLDNVRSGLEGAGFATRNSGYCGTKDLFLEVEIGDNNSENELRRLTELAQSIGCHVEKSAEVAREMSLPVA